MLLDTLRPSLVCFSFSICRLCLCLSLWPALSPLLYSGLRDLAFCTSARSRGSLPRASENAHALLATYTAGPWRFYRRYLVTNCGKIFSGVATPAHGRTQCYPGCPSSLRRKPERRWTNAGPSLRPPTTWRQLRHIRLSATSRRCETSSPLRGQVGKVLSRRRQQGLARLF